MNQLQDLARNFLEQHYFVGGDGLLYTPGGRAARSTIRIARRIFPTSHVVAEMRRQSKQRT
ncbi:MAG: hypothetical protein KDJ39_08610 [Gammaproteobacteria bacterium]|nr:hypothetical protein [Gammaproteobacteria bacterium]MCP5298907.1 hypothetical protein [Chromatiaceae bacterium]